MSCRRDRAIAERNIEIQNPTADRMLRLLDANCDANLEGYAAHHRHGTLVWGPGIPSTRTAPTRRRRAVLAGCTICRMIRPHLG